MGSQKAASSYGYDNNYNDNNYGNNYNNGYGDGDANSDDGNGFNGNGLRIEAHHHDYYRSESVKGIESPRDQWATNKNAPNPTKGLNFLWCILGSVLVAAVAGLTTIDSSMMMMCIDMDAEGTYFWNIGWNNANFGFFNNAKSDQALQYTTASAETAFPIPNTMLYARNAGRMLLGCIFVMMLCAAYILMVLCTRCNSHVLLYVKICCCRVPQRGSIRFAFDVLKTVCWATAVFYVVLGIYGLLETNFYLTTACPGGNTCWAYIIPHYGFVCLLISTLAVSCCAFGRVQKLDVALNLKSMQLYYPENLRTAESRNSTIDLQKLFDCISCIKNVCILSFVMLCGFGDVGLLSMVFYDEAQSSTTNAVMFFQHQGLVNSEGVAYNSYIDARADGDDPFLITTSSPIEEYSESFEQMAQLWRGWIGVIFVLNLCVFLPYTNMVVLKYRSIGCCKFSIVLFSFVEWLLFTILMGLYYYEFHVFFNNHAKSSLQDELDQTSDASDFVISWFPDWGVIVALLLWGYLIKLMMNAFKAM